MYISCEIKSDSLSKENSKVIYNLLQDFNRTPVFAILCCGFFSECLNCYDCTMKFGNSYQNRNSSILTKSEKNSFNKMEINYTIFVAVFTSIVLCDVMNTQNRYAGNKMTKCTSLHLPLFKTEWRYFLNSSYLTFFFWCLFLRL